MWQLHYAVDAGADHNVARNIIANPDEKNDGGNYFQALARPDGSFTVENSRNREKKTYTESN